MMHHGANQRVPEYHAWTRLCLGLGTRTYVELGNGSAFEQASLGIRTITVDLLPQGIGQEHVQGDSHDAQTLARVQALLGGDPDIVFIDADHSYESTKRDFELWYPAARIAVGFHDILHPGSREFWEEICLRYPSVQIVGRDIASVEAWQAVAHVNGQVQAGGVGVIFK
jgi:hypothetical protein